MDRHPIGELMETSLGKIREMVDVNTIIGQPISTVDGITIIPVSRVSFGFAGGGSDFQGKSAKQDQKSPFGGGTAGGVKIEPVAFVVIKDGIVRIQNIAPPAFTAIDRAIDMAPEIIDKITDMVNKKKEEAPETDK